ncbi:hypothetical protein [Falsirhodobacter xinxiangensis]|uniref:hypothetical protein n=1 Tax=Falsirhodobacter xinxiangensis TaxID=2530049 RepID=UPI0010AA61D9|nr:hypothetical protein [Rhodobacter xinxiangensis]
MERHDIDSEDLTALLAPIGAITLIATPCGTVDEWISAAKPKITIGPHRGSLKPQPWLDICDLEGCSFAPFITEAYLQSDVFMDWHGLTLLTNAEVLIIYVTGHAFDDDHVQAFWNAISEMPKLKLLTFVCTPEALEFCEGRLFWPDARFTVTITTPQRRRPKIRSKTLIQ